MTLQEIEKFIEKNKYRHLSNKVLHAHPSPTCWSTSSAREKTANNLATALGQKYNVNLYVGIPYCLPTDPPRCGFCLFPTAKYSGVKDTSDYLNYVAREAALYKDFYKNSIIESLYVGGGTPNLLSQPDYFQLMEIVQDLFPGIGDKIEKTLEGIPQLFSEKKIRAISEAGFNRVSMGVQQISDRLIKYSGRKQTRKQVFDAIDYFHKYNLSCNIDMIYGWPEQTVDDMLSDLEELTASGVRHITHYELNIAGRSNFATQQKELVPDMPGKIKMYHEAKEYLLSRGYKQRTVYDWEMTEVDNSSANKGSEKYLYENNLRDFLPEDKAVQSSFMGGIGFSAINIRMRPLDAKTPSISSMNHKNLHKYYDDVSAGKLPIERVYVHDEEDVKLVWLFQSLQEMKINIVKYNKLFKTSLLDDFKDIWLALEREQWIEYMSDEIRVVGDGEFYTPLIQSLISKSRINTITSRQSVLRKAQ